MRLHYLILAVVTLLLAGCGGTPEGTLQIPNADPRASNNLTQINVIPPDGWELTASGDGLTDGAIVITTMTLSDLPVTPGAVLADVTGETTTHNGRDIILQSALNRLIAWTVIDGTLTTFTMQGRTEAPFSPAQQDLLLQLVSTASF